MSYGDGYPKEQGVPFSDEDEVCQSVRDDSSLALLDDIGKDGKGRREASISVREYIYGRTFRPGDVGGGVDGGLDVCTIKVEWSKLYVLE